MRIVMINDCAYVGETILKYLSPEIDKQHVKRTRGIWSKTFGLAYRILKAKGDAYHAHYLLQDCYIAARLGKRPLIGHAHGSDLRAALNHPLWGRIVRHNLKHSDMVLVGTPDLVDVARRFRKDAEYLPNPVDMKLFHFKPLPSHSGRKRVLVASQSNWAVKGTDIAVRALSRIRDDVDVSILAYGADLARTVTLASSLGLRINTLPTVPHGSLAAHYWNADVVIDQFKLGALGMISLEAIACGRPVVTYVSSQYPQYKEFPSKDVDSDEQIASAVRDADPALWQEQNAYLNAHHKPEDVVRQLLTIYDSLVSQPR